MGDTSSPARKRRKILLACIPCRQRKVRCGGERPVCATCTHRSLTTAHVECSYEMQSDYATDMADSIKSLLERLQRLENQSASTLTSQLDPEVLPINGDNNATPVTCLVSKQPISSSTSSVAYSAPTTTPPPALQTPAKVIHGSTWGPGGLEVSKELAQVAVDAADAMGAYSMCSESSPESSAQYYGGSSGIAFMRAVSEALAERAQGDEEGVDDFSHAGRVNHHSDKQRSGPELLQQLPTFENPTFRPDCFTLPLRSLSDHLLGNYWARAYPLYPFLHRPTFEAAYATLWSHPTREDHLSQESDTGLGNVVDAGPSSQTFYYALNMMLALGTQFSDVSALERKELTKLFEQRSKNLLIVDMMDQGSLAIVQALLLEGQYLQSTFYPQRCWNSVGAACRIAQGLGLYVDEFPITQKAKVGLEMRKRVWYGCMMLDMSASMTMGRPLMVSHKFSTAPPSPLDEEQFPVSSFGKSHLKNFPAIGFFLQAIKLSKTLGIILTTLYDQAICSINRNASPNEKSSFKHVQTPADIDAVIELDKKLVKFRDEVPTELQWGQDGEKLRATLEPTMGKLQMLTNVLHARFLQTRILLYRTTFIQLCQDSISTKSDIALGGGVGSVELDVDTYFMTRFAVSCVSSARELIQLVNRTSESECTDAWWYNIYYAHISGMVMKLAQLCSPLKQVVETSSINESWEICRETLLRMCSHGPAAHRCLESLESIQGEITVLESRISKAKDRTRQGSMPSDGSRILSSSQLTDNLNSSEQPYLVEGQSEAHPHTDKHGTVSESVLDNVLPDSESHFTLDGSEKDYSNWPTDLRDWWSFPVVGLEFDSLA